MTVYKGTIKDENGNPLYPATSADKVSGLATVATSGSYNDLSNKPTIPDISGKLDKVSYEWNKAVNFGSSGYLKIGSFPMYDSNITIDIDATTSNTYHGTVIIATQNVSTTSMGSAHKVEVYGDPTGTIANSLRVTWESGSRNYNIFFVPQSWSKNLIHIRASALNASPTDVCTSQTGTAPTTTTGLEPVNKLNIPSIPTTSTAGKVLKSTSTAGTVEWGDVNSGSSDYDDLDHKPIINQYGSATLTSFTNGETISNGQILHMDLTKGSDVASFLTNLTYTGEGGVLAALAGGDRFTLAAYNLTSMSMGYALILVDRTSDGEQIRVLYGTTSGDVGDMSWNAGFNNLDENGNITVSLLESEQIQVGSQSGWNGVLIWKNSLSYSPSISDGKYFLKDNRLYHKVSTDEKKVLQEGDISFDSTITQSSTNGVQSSAIYNALADKQNSISYSTVNYGTANSMLGLDGNGDLIYDNLPNISGKQDQISSVQVTLRQNDWYSTNDAPYSYKSNGKTVSGIESTDLVVLINSYDSNKAIRLIDRDGTTLYFGTTASSQPTETYQQVLIIKGAANSSRNFANFEIPITESAQFASGTVATAIGFDTNGKLVKGTISAGGVTSVNGQTGAVTGLLESTDASTSATANTIVKRDANGDINGRYIIGTWLQTTNATDTASWTDVFVNSSGWLYKRSKANFISDLGIAGGKLDFKYSVSLDNNGKAYAVKFLSFDKSQITNWGSSPNTFSIRLSHKNMYLSSAFDEIVTCAYYNGGFTSGQVTKNYGELIPNQSSCEVASMYGHSIGDVFVVINGDIIDYYVFVYPSSSFTGVLEISDIDYLPTGAIVTISSTLTKYSSGTIQWLSNQGVIIKTNTIASKISSTLKLEFVGRYTTATVPSGITGNNYVVLPAAPYNYYGGTFAYTGTDANNLTTVYAGSAPYCYYKDTRYTKYRKQDNTTAQIANANFWVIGSVYKVLS